MADKEIEPNRCKVTHTDKTVSPASSEELLLEELEKSQTEQSVKDKSVRLKTKLQQVLEKDELEQLIEQQLKESKKEVEDFKNNLPKARLEKIESINIKDISQQEKDSEIIIFDLNCTLRL